MNLVEKNEKAFIRLIVLAMLTSDFLLNPLYWILNLQLTSIHALIILLLNPITYVFFIPLLIIRGWLIYKINQARDWARIIYSFLTLLGIIVLGGLLLTNVPEIDYFQKSLAISQICIQLLILYTLSFSGLAYSFGKIPLIKKFSIKQKIFIKSTIENFKKQGLNDQQIYDELRNISDECEFIVKAIEGTITPNNKQQYKSKNLALMFLITLHFVLFFISMKFTITSGKFSYSVDMGLFWMLILLYSYSLLFISKFRTSGYYAFYLILIYMLLYFGVYMGETNWVISSVCLFYSLVVIIFQSRLFSHLLPKDTFYPVFDSKKNTYFLR
jgi:hypothetical protein